MLRALRLALRTAREEAGLKTRELAARLDWAPSVLSRLESGKGRIPDEVDVAQVLTACGVPAERRDELVELCRAARSSSNWIADLKDLPDQLRTLLDYEQYAQTITEVATTIVPGLLQTPEYMRAVFAAAAVADSAIIKRVELRRLRQRVIDSGLQVVALLNEPMLGQVIGSPAITAAQLTRLRELAQRPTVTIRVIPNGARFLPVNGSYAMLEFADLPPVVYDEHVAGGTFVDDERQVAAMVEELGRLSTVALSPRDSAELLTSAITRLEDR